MKLKNKFWQFIIDGKSTQVLTVFALLGLAGLVSRFFIILFFYFILLNYFISPKKDKYVIVSHLLILIIPFELFGRMLGADPLLPWELGKYLGIPIIIHAFATFVNLKKLGIGLVILLCSIPALLLTITISSTWFKDLVFNYFGIFNLGLTSIFFYNLKLSKHEILKVLKTFMLGATMVLVYVIIETPNLANLDFQLGANFDVTGGFGSNQVATILGTGFGIGILLWLLQYKVFQSHIFNLVLPAVFLLWSILSFSRGGVISATLALILVLIFTSKGKGMFKVRKIDPALIISLSIVIVGLAYGANEITGGQLLLRYSGETYGTYYANQEKDLSTLTTSRSDIFFSDIKVWQEYFWLGVGAGQSPKVRSSMGYDAEIAHVEVSRLLSEHGFFGLIIVFILILTPVYKYLKAHGSFAKAIVLFCFTIAIVTSMHSAMRTYTSPFFFGFAFIGIMSEKNSKKKVKERDQNSESSLFRQYS